MLNFLGKGSCFNVGEVNTSAYYKRDNYLMLIDCGESVFKEIVDTHLLDGIDEFDILITHFHSDHIGSLPSLLFYAEFLYKIKPTIIYPVKEEMELFLKMAGNHPSYFNVVEPEDFKRFKIEAIKQVHSEYIDAYGYLISLDDKIIYYSGDSKKINEKIMNMFIENKIDYFFQDVSNYETSAHMFICDLEKMIPESRRPEIVCMHFDDNKTKALVLEKMFRA